MTRTSHWMALLAAGLLYAATPAHAQTKPDFPRTDDHLLIEYSRYSEKFADRDPTPSLRIYGSGRTVVYWPAYTPRAGIYETRLRTDQLDALLARITSGDLHRIDTFQLRAIAEAATKQQAAPGEFYYTSDRTVTTLNVFLPGARPEALTMVNLADTDQRAAGTPFLGDYASLARDLQAIVNGDLGTAVAAPLSMEELRQ